MPGIDGITPRDRFPCSCAVGGAHFPRSLSEGYPPGAPVRVLDARSPFKMFRGLLTEKQNLAWSYDEIGIGWSGVGGFDGGQSWGWNNALELFIPLPDC